MSTLAPLLIAGLVSGSIYALIASGYAVIYTATGFVNFALGAQVMLGGYVFYVFVPDGPIVLRICIALVGGALFSVLSWKLFYVHVAERDHLAATIMSFGMSIVLAELVRIWAGGTPKAAVSPFGSTVHSLGPVSLSNHSVAVLTTCLLTAGLLIAAFRSRTGATVRAMFQDRETAEMLGVRTARTTTILFAVSGAFASLAGLLVGPTLSLSPGMGTHLGLIAFVGAVLGGLGRVETALAGGLLLGLLEALFAGYVSADYRASLVFLTFIAVLVVRPSGVFGTVFKVKV